MPQQIPQIGEDVSALMPEVGADVSSLMESTPTAKPSGLERFVRGAGREFIDTINPFPALKAIKDTVMTPGASDRMPQQFADMTAAQRDFGRETQGKSIEEIGRSAGETFKQSDPVDVTGRMAGQAAALALPFGVKKTVGAVRSGMESRAAVRLPGQIQSEMELAFPPTPSRPYQASDVDAAKPYLNAQHQATPITTAKGAIEAMDAAVDGIEDHVRKIVGTFPTARVQTNVRNAIGAAFAKDPDTTAMSRAMGEVERFNLDQPKSLPEAEAIRRRLNAENKAVLKRNNYDVDTARQTDPGFAAREIAADQYRNAIYDYLEERGVEGVRQLRRDEGSLLKVRGAALRQEFAGARSVAGTEPGLGRKIIGNVVKTGSTATGAAVGGPGGAVAGATLGDEMNAMIRGSARTRDDIVRQLFGRPDARLPSYPVIPEQPPIRGLLGEGARPMPASPDPSGPTTGGGMPSSYPLNERRALPPARAVHTPVGPDPSGLQPVDATQLPEAYQRALQQRPSVAGPSSTGMSYAPILTQQGQYADLLRQAIMDALNAGKLPE